MASVYRLAGVPLQRQIPRAVHPPPPPRRRQGGAVALEDQGGTGEGGARRQSGAVEGRDVAPGSADPATAGLDREGLGRLGIGARGVVLGARGGDGADRLLLDRPPLGRVAVDLLV